MQIRFWPLYILISAFLAAPVYAQMYKWTDDKGQVHFGDSIPAKYLNKQHEILNQEGQTVKQIQAAPTKAQLAEKARLAKIAKKKAEKEAAQEREDRVLLDTYTSVHDLTVARDSRFEAEDSQIKLSESIIASSQKKLNVFKKRAKLIKAHGRKVPPYLAENIKNNEEQIANQEDVKKSLVAQRKKTADQFSAYIKRFRELMAQENKSSKDDGSQDQSSDN